MIDSMSNSCCIRRRTFPDRANSFLREGVGSRRTDPLALRSPEEIEEALGDTRNRHHGVVGAVILEVRIVVVRLHHASTKDAVRQ